MTVPIGVTGHNDVEDDVNDGFITQCTPAYKNIKVGIGGSETC